MVNTRLVVNTAALVVFIVIPTLALSGCPKQVPGTLAEPLRRGPTPTSLAEALRQCEVVESYQLSMAVSPNESVTQLVRFESGVPVRVMTKTSECWLLTARDEKALYQYLLKDNIALRLPAHRILACT